MSRQDVNIGLTGNDGTGDSIRDAFSKVNENFQELYASQGLEGGLSFDSLSNVTKPLVPNRFLSIDSLGKNVVGREIFAGAGIAITVQDDKVVISTGSVDIVRDPNPTLSNHLDAATNRIQRLGDPLSDQDAVTRKWIYQNFLNRDSQEILGATATTTGSVMRQNFRITPTPDNGNTNLGLTQFINLKAADGITNKTSVLLNQQGTLSSHAVRKDYADSKISLHGTDAIDPATGLRDQGFGTMTGPLILNDHPGDYATLTKKPSGELFVREDYRAATKGYVDSKSYDSTTNLYVTTNGNDDLWDFENNRPNPIYGYTVKEIGRKWSTAFKTVRAACAYAKLYMDQITLSDTGFSVAPGNITRYNPTFAPAGPRTRVRVSLQNHGFRDGDYVFVTGAIVVGNNDTRALNGTHRVNQVDVNTFELDLKSTILWATPVTANNSTDPIIIKLANAKDGPYSLSSSVALGQRGYAVPKYEITIMIETGVYEEYMPIIVPPNVALRGDEFRRTIIKPAPGPVVKDTADALARKIPGTPTEDIKFVRGDQSFASPYWYNTHYYKHLALANGQQSIGSTTLTIFNSAYPPKSGTRFIVNNIQYRVGDESTISYIDPITNIGTAQGTYTMAIVDENGDPKPLQNTILQDTTITFYLDNEHCDMLLVDDAFQLRNLSFYGHKGFIMAFNPAGQILTRSPYAQVCGSFSNKGGGGQLIDGMAGNQVCQVDDTTYTDPNTGNSGSRGTRMYVKGLIRPVQLPNTFYFNKKRYVIKEATIPDAQGKAMLTLEDTTPIEEDDTYLTAGFLPNGTQIMIQTAGNRSMLSNDFTMINNLGYGIYADNNGVTEAVSQFTYYCKISYLARAGGQVRSVTGSSCYGQYGLQSEGSDPNEATQIVRFNTDVVNLMTPQIDDPEVDGLVGAISFVAGGFNSAPTRNSTFLLNKARVVISQINRARLGGGTLTTGPLTVITAHPHPFKTGEEIQLSNIKPDRGLQLNPIPPSVIPRNTNLDGTTHTVTVVDQRTFTLDNTESTNYYSDLIAYTATESQPYAIQNLVPGALELVYSVKGDPSPVNFTASARFDGVVGENSTSTSTLKLFSATRPAQVGMKFRLDATNPAVNDSSQVYKVLTVSKKVVTFKAVPPTASDNKIGATILYVRNVTFAGTAVNSQGSAFAPKAGWSFQLRDSNIANSDFTRYTVTGTPTYDSGSATWALMLDQALTVNMVDQVATGRVTTVDGIWDVTLDRNLGTTITNSATPVQFVFYDAYWTIGIDPSLSVAIPQEQQLMLFQQRSVRVHQVLNNPTIINSSALKFGATNFDSTVYRIIAKTAEGGLSKDVYKLAATAQPLLGNNLNAVSILNQNKSFIQSEVIAYLATIYPDFVYTQSTCYRDVGLIIDAVAYDMTYGGNIRSIAAGKSYYQANNASVVIVIAEQKPETVDAINYATTVAKLALAKTSLSYSGINPNAALQLTNNKAFIIAEVIAWLSFTYPSFVYDRAIYRRDIEVVIDAMIYDLKYNGNVKTLQAAQAYYDENGALILSTQKPQIRASVVRAKNVAKDIIAKNTVSKTTTGSDPNILTQTLTGSAGEVGTTDTVETLMGVIDSILNSGLGVSPARNLGDPRLYQNPANPGYVAQTIPGDITSEVGTPALLENRMNIITNIVQNGLTAVPQAQATGETIQTLVFPPDANMLIYGGVLTGPNIPPNTIIRASQQDSVTGNYIAKISNTISGTISADTELTITGPGFDFIFDLNTDFDVRHLNGDRAYVTTTFSTVRATGHDFLEVGTGGFDDSNYPHNVYGQSVNSPSEGRIVREIGTGRVFHVSTDQNGNFRVGSYFNVNQGDGTVSITAKIGLTAVSAISFASGGALVTQFGTDPKMGDNADYIVPTQKAIVSYITAQIRGRFEDGVATTKGGLLTLDGESSMAGPIKVNYNEVEGVINSTDTTGFGAVNRKYVDNVFAGGTIDYDGQYAIALTGVRTNVLGFTMRQDRTSLGGVLQNFGLINLNGNKITNVRTPTATLDAANKIYVDQTIANGGVRTNWDGFALRTAGTYGQVSSSFTVLNSGTGYTTAPVVTFVSSSGTGAQASATVVGNSVVGITLDFPGSGYTSAPTIIIGGAIATVNVISQGSGYGSAPLIDFPEPQTSGGVKATAVTNINASGQITSVTVLNGGSGYTIAPIPFLVVNTGGAVFSSTLSPGTGATASCTLVTTLSNINLSGNKVTGSADPTQATDLVTWQYFDNNHWIKDNKDITITGTPGDGDLLMFTGYVPSNVDTDKRRSMVNVRLTPNSDITFARTDNQLLAKVKDNILTNAQINASAGIDQSKLNLKTATVFPPINNPGQAVPLSSDLGISTYDTDQFVVDSGLVKLRQATSNTTGVTLNRISHVTNFKILGRNDTSSGAPVYGPVVELSTADLRSLLNFQEAVQNLISDDSLDTPLVNRANQAPSYGAVLKTGSSMRGPLTLDVANQDINQGLNPMIRVATDNVYEVGTAAKRFKNIYSAMFTGTLTGNVTGKADTAGTADRVANNLSAGSWISMVQGSTASPYNGSAGITISVSGVSTSSTGNSIAQRDASGFITAAKFIGPLNGTADNATTLATYSPAINSAGTGTANSIAQRDGNGYLNAARFQGTATSAFYADLAERYQADTQYEPGTVLEFGGEFEVTVAEDETRRIAGVVSTNPAFEMNTVLEGENVVAVALMGRVPCKVRGVIRKGDMLVSGGGGYARPTTDPKLGTIIGKALENFDGGEGIIEVVVGRL